jgi:CRISPR-associated protein Csc3
MSEQHDAVRRLAEFAAAHRIWGRSFHRSSLLDPFAQILEWLERWPNPDDRDYLRGMLKTEISTRIERISPYGVRAERRQAIYQYVDLFFDEVLKGEHYDRAQSLLDRARLLKGAYLLFLRNALPAAQRKAADDESDELPDEDGVIASPSSLIVK